MKCAQCSKEIARPENSCTTGYGIDSRGRKICLACCGRNDRARTYNLPIGGRTILYLMDHELTNWPGTFRVPARVRRGRHNIARWRYDAWFTLHGHNGEHYYHAVTYGDMTQIAHVRRVKSA